MEWRKTFYVQPASHAAAD